MLRKNKKDDEFFDIPILSAEEEKAFLSDEKSVEASVSPSHCKFYSDGIGFFGHSMRLSNLSKNINRYLKPFSYSAFFTVLPFLFPQVAAREQIYFSDTDSVKYLLNTYRSRHGEILYNELANLLPCNITLDTPIAQNGYFPMWEYTNNITLNMEKNYFGETDLAKCIVYALGDLIKEHAEQWDKEEEMMQKILGFCLLAFVVGTSLGCHAYDCIKHWLTPTVPPPIISTPAAVATAPIALTPGLGR